MTKINDSVLAICIQEIKEDGSEINIDDILHQKDIEYLNQAFIADTIVNASELSLIDVQLYYADYPETKKSVTTIIKYLKTRLKGKQVKFVEKLNAVKLNPERWGLKIEKVFQKCFKDGYKHVLLIGNRTPTLKAERIKTALKVLKKSDAVFGPTVEGRYYLIGMSDKYHVQLSNFDWRSATIYSEVANHFRELNLSWSELELWYAVENHDDLEFLVRDINHYRLIGDEISAKETELVLQRILSR